MTGSYCWTVAGTSACADMPAFTDSGPDLPVVTLPSTATQLQFSLTDSYPFASWSASYVDDNGNVVALGGGGSSFDPDAVRPVDPGRLFRHLRPASRLTTNLSSRSSSASPMAVTRATAGT